ncbi:DUF6497 family protein [Aliiroseovarius sp. F47248L]|uniref:DUF6497 family protein n=1 Tax=Aliiroseovarius sp. F47248L TaxID=2926420 RepID=UPI001FF542C6|nr:DUF6497 family protein [Aliiroseovarius sp. F47248L]MCK0137789.1 DUF6497 family protein [Aliiroseovarius sp. F47248L]
MTCEGKHNGPLGLVGVAVCAAALSLTAPVAAGSTDAFFETGTKINVPSGQEIMFLDVIEGEDSAVGTAIRVRFLAPRIARDSGDVEFMQAEEDMATLCQDYVLPQMVNTGIAMPAQIIIVLSDRVVEHGMTDPDATQFFEAYRPESGMCVWEGF